MRRHLLLLCAALHLAGCAAVSGFPKPIFSERDEEAELKLYVKAASVEHYEECVDKFACRNAIIDARVRAIDVAFYRFERRLFSQESRVSLGTDMLSMAMDSVAAITATRGLAAGAGLLTGSRDAYEKQAMSVSMPLLLQEMSATRREILVRIRQGQTMPVSAYSLVEALSDTSEYELAGSIPAAAAQMSANAGTQSRAAEEKLSAMRAAAFAHVQSVPPAAATLPVAAATPLVAPATSAVPAGPATTSTVMPSTGPSTGPGSAAVVTPGTGPSTGTIAGQPTVTMQ